MVRIYPRRAIVVAKLGLAEVRQIFEVRLALEPAAAASAMHDHVANSKKQLLKGLERVERPAGR